MATSSATGPGRTRALNPLFGYVFGAVFLVVGLLGFFVSGGHAFAGEHGGMLLGVFMVNPLHNIVHLLVGGLLIAGARGGVTLSRSVNTLVGAVYLVVGVLGLFVLGTAVNILALNSADNTLHFASAAVLLGAGLAFDHEHAHA